MKKLNYYIVEVWSGVKQQANIENIKDWCEDMGIENYTINSKGEIDVDGYVDLEGKRIKELPYKFGRVNGFFDISGCKNLTSLKNCPNCVEGTFNCSNCPKLDSLKNCPNEVGEYFSCRYCSQLNSLEGCPKVVGYCFYCSDCKRDFTKEEVQALCAVEKNNIFV